MKLSVRHLLAKVRSASISQASIALGLLLLFALGTVPLVLYMVLGKVIINDKSAFLATTIGGIVGPFLSFLTLAFVLLNNQSDNREKYFRQTLDFTERLLKVYTEAVNEYEAVGKKTQVFDEKFRPVVGFIVPYLRATEPLFAVVMQHLKTSRFDKLQYAGLLGIMRGQLRPLVVIMQEEMEHLDRDMSLEYNQIASRQLTELDDLLDNSQ